MSQFMKNHILHAFHRSLNQGFVEGDYPFSGNAAAPAAGHQADAQGGKGDIPGLCDGIHLIQQRGENLAAVIIREPLQHPPHHLLILRLRQSEMKLILLHFHPLGSCVQLQSNSAAQAEEGLPGRIREHGILGRHTAALYLTDPLDPGTEKKVDFPLGAAGGSRNQYLSVRMDP